MLEVERHETHSAQLVKTCMTKIQHGAAEVDTFGTQADAYKGQVSGITQADQAQVVGGKDSCKGSELACLHVYC